MDKEILISGIFLVVFVVIVIIPLLSGSKKDQWVSTEDFQREKVKLRPHCSDEEFLAFMRFLYSYQGGYIRRRSGQMGDVAKEYDHLVIGRSGIFSIETKAFGMSYGRPSKASLFIDEGDKWIIRKNGNNRDLTSPTEQVLEEQKHLQSIISYPMPVHPILVLSNTELFIKNNIKLPYDIIRVDMLKEYIENYQDNLTDIDKMLILQEIDASRIN